MDRRELDRLWSAFLEGESLGPAEESRLSAAVEADPLCARALLEDQGMHRALLAYGRPWPSAEAVAVLLRAERRGDRFVGGVRLRLAAARRGRRLRATGAILVLAAAAAAAAIWQASRDRPAGRVEVPPPRPSGGSFSREDRPVGPRPKPSAPAPIAAPPGRRAGGTAASTVLLSFDFEGEILPPAVRTGALVPGPSRPGNRSCVMAKVDLRRPDRLEFMIRLPMARMIRYTSDLVVTFDYWLPATENGLRLSVWNPVLKQSHGRDLPDLSAGAWAHAEVPLALLVPESGPSLREGDPLRNLSVRGGAVGGPPFFIDNLQVIER